MAEEEEEVHQRALTRLGTVLRGKYRLDHVLGSGGMASVYAATHRNSKRFAVKMLHPELSLRADLRARFLREGYVANQVQHPGAVAVLDDDVAEDGSAFLVMELLEGETVEQVWQAHGGRMPLGASLAIADQLLEVLAAAHARGIVHRDIKPANLFVTHEGQLKVLDFGIARLRDAATSSATSTGMIVGTPAFMSPEQALGNPAEVDARSDVWAAGAVVFSLLTGRFVHEGASVQQTLVMAATTPAPSLATLCPEAGPAVIRFVDRALHFAKATRWASAVEMREALGAAAQSSPAGPISRETLAALGGGSGSVPPAATRPSGRPSGWPHPAATPDGMLPTQLAVTPLPAQPSFGVATARTAAMTTAMPVSRDAAATIPSAPPAPGLAATGARHATSPLLWIAVGIGLAGAVGGSVALVQRGSAGSPRPDATGQPPPAASVVLAPPSAMAPVAPPAASPAAASASSAPAATPPPAARPAATPARPTATTPAAPPPASAAKATCNPPYEYDAQGNKKWKRECL